MLQPRRCAPRSRPTSFVDARARRPAKILHHSRQSTPRTRKCLNFGAIPGVAPSLRFGRGNLRLTASFQPRRLTGSRFQGFAPLAWKASSSPPSALRTGHRSRSRDHRPSYRAVRVHSRFLRRSSKWHAAVSPVRIFPNKTSTLLFYPSCARSSSGSLAKIAAKRCALSRVSSSRRNRRLVFEIHVAKGLPCSVFHHKSAIEFLD
jgi:hypothetical protein